MSTAHASAERTRGRALSDAVLAEAAKLGSLPAIWLVYAGTLVLTVVFAIAFSTNAEFGSGSVSVLDYGVVAVSWTQVGFFLIGVIASTSEYIGGQVRTTLIAIPDHVAWRLAATVALATLVFAMAAITVAVSVLTVLVNTGTSVGDIDVLLTLRITLSAAVYLALMAILSSALGIFIRKAIPTAGILLVYLLIVSPILSPLLQGLNLYVLPDIAAYTLWFATVPEAAPPASIGWLVVAAWTIAFLIASISVARRRDT